MQEIQPFHTRKPVIALAVHQDRKSPLENFLSPHCATSPLIRFCRQITLQTHSGIFLFIA